MNRRYYAATFETSASDPRQCPTAIAEAAFAGRSNAGKSSAINTLTRNGKLARTGKTPGRTQLINHFALGEQRYLVDLPGYGYAAVSKSRQQAWRRALGQYLHHREALRGLVVVMDIRHPMTDTDRMLIDIQQGGTADLHVLLTKADKLSKSAALRTLHAVQRSLEADGVEATLQTFSSLKATGVDDLHAVLDAWLFDAPLALTSSNPAE